MVPLAEVFFMPPREARELQVIELAAFADVIDRRIAESNGRQGKG